MLAQMAVRESSLDENKQKEDMQQALNPRVSKPQGCRTLIAHSDSSLHVLERCFTDEAVMADALDVEQTSVGGKADFPQFLEIFDAPANVEVASIIDGRFGSKGFVPPCGIA